MQTSRRCYVGLLVLLFFGIISIILFRQVITPVYIWIHSNATKLESRFSSPIIFVGGMPRSGTTLMRVLLDVHPWIRCGPEGMVIEPMLIIRHNLSEYAVNRSREAGVYPDLLDSAMANYIWQIIKGMGAPAKMLCYKRPGVLIYMEYLARLFPQSKFVLMLRDGRAVAVSEYIRWHKDLGTVFRKWMSDNVKFLGGCQRLGPKRCIIVRYELLVLNPEHELRLVMDFLGVPWDPALLHHEKLLGNSSTLNPNEPSTSQVKNEINLEALTRWLQSDPLIKNFVLEAQARGWLLKTLGYLDIGQPPNYRKLPREIPDISDWSYTE